MSSNENAATEPTPNKENQTQPHGAPDSRTSSAGAAGASTSPPDADSAEKDPNAPEPDDEADARPDGQQDAAFKTLVVDVAKGFAGTAPASASAQPADEPHEAPPLTGSEGARKPPTEGPSHTDTADTGAAPGGSAAAPTPAPTATPNAPSVPISLAHAGSTKFAVVDVPIHRVADFLNVVGAALAAASFVDARCWVGRRQGNPSTTDWAQRHGMIVDVCEPSSDPLASIVTAGLPVPTVWWPTENGFKGLWVFDQSTFPETFIAMAEEFVVALRGGNPALWLPTHGHHLPVVLKSTGSGLSLVNQPAAQASTEPFRVVSYSPLLPPRLERVLAGERTLTPGERQQVTGYLAGVGLTVPNPGCYSQYDRCPLAVHGRTCCFVGVRHDGSVFVTCVAKHGREGRKDWNELGLLDLATGAHVPFDGIDPVVNIPGTWAGLEYFRTKLLGEFTGSSADALMAAAARVWFRAKAGMAIGPLVGKAYAKNIRLKDAPPWHKYVEFYERKIAGDETGPCQVFFDGVRQELRLVYGQSSKALKIKGPTLSTKANYHEYDGSLAIDVSAELRENEETGKWAIVVSPEVAPAAASLWNKALTGNTSHLAALGLPRMSVHELPVAFVEPSISIDLKTRCIEIVRTAHTKPGDARFDAFGFLASLHREGRLPLASEADVARFLMAIASPLLRDVAPGLLGIYWFVGPSGAGKDYLAVLVEEIWRDSVINPVKAAFDLHTTDETEQKRAFATAAPAVYARAKEAGKSLELITTLIKLAGTNQVTARGLWRDEVQLTNTFTYLADSVEDLPERKEISRRTVMIGVGQIGDEISKGRVRTEILQRAPDIIANLKALVESRPVEWYLEQANTGSRPVVPVALAQLFGATLPQVSGGGTDELFENVESYIKTFGAAEGKKQQADAREKDGKEQKLFPSYRLAHFVDQMSQEVGSRNFFKLYGSKRGIEMLLHREADYHTVESGKLPYLPVTLNGKRFAFKLVKGRRNFVFVDELVYCNKLGIEPISAPQSRDETADDAKPPDEPTVAETPAAQQSGPMRFNTADLRDEPTEAANASNGK
jgi:hypothetical protein